jgi:hypothetical protein
MRARARGAGAKLKPLKRKARAGRRLVLPLRLLGTWPELIGNRAILVELRIIARDPEGRTVKRRVVRLAG